MSRALEMLLLHPRHRKARRIVRGSTRKSVGGGSAAGDRSGAGGGPSRGENGRGARIRYTLISCAPATRPCRSCTRMDHIRDGGTSLDSTRGGDPARPGNLSPWPPPRAGGGAPASNEDAGDAAARNRCRARQVRRTCFIDRAPQVEAYGIRTANEDAAVKPTHYRPKPGTVQQVWIRATGKLGDDLALHRCVLAYASDFTLLGYGADRPWPLRVRPALDAGRPDHALWFHRQFQADRGCLPKQPEPPVPAEPSAAALCHPRGRPGGLYQPRGPGAGNGNI